MAHKTLIGGTAYEIKGGKTLVDGTAYSIKSGKTLVGGTVYEVGFGSDLPGTFFLRPSADVFVDDTITLYPSGSTAAYLLLNETITDKTSTYIGVTATSEGDVDGTARCTMSGDIPNNVSKVNSIRVYASGDESGFHNDSQTTLGSSFLRIIIDGTSWRLDFATNSTANVWGGQFKDSNYEVLEAGEYYNDVSSELLAAINDYISANGTLPEIEMEFELSAHSYADGSKVTNGYSRISQVYIVLDCE